MADKTGGGSGSSSQNNGPNQRADAASKEVGLTNKEHEAYRRELEETRENRTYKELVDIAKEHKK